MARLRKNGKEHPKDDAQNAQEVRLFSQFEPGDLRSLSGLVDFQIALAFDLLHGRIKSNEANGGFRACAGVMRAAEYQRRYYPKTEEQVPLLQERLVKGRT